MMPLERARCLVLGGGGFIGTHLSRALAEQGARVTGFGRRQSYPEALVNISFVTAEFSDTTALAAALEHQDVVFHVLGSAAPEASNRDPVADLTNQVLATLRLLELCRLSGKPKIVFISSGGTVYGIPTSWPIQEGAATDPICAYGAGKLAVEKYLGVYNRVHTQPYVILRLANPFGPWQRPGRGQGVIATLLQRTLRGEPVEIWGDGKVVRDFIYIDDVVRAILGAALYEGPHHIFNVGSGIGRSIGGVAADIAGVLGQDHAAITHTSGRPVDVPINVLDIGLIRRELGWNPSVPWLDGLMRTADWIRSA